nr:MAG TPA: Protein of unknown function (DUF2800) [Caudoviricetes sp.]
MTEHSFSMTDMRAAMQRIVDGGHSVFSPSGSPMWLNCSGSLIPNLFAEDDSGEDAAYGTVGHMVGETWLKTRTRPNHLLGTRHFVQSGEWGYFITVDESMMEYVKRYVDWCRFLPGDHHVETRVDFSQLTPIPGQGGTADHAACTWQRLVITDLKMGKGVRVYAKENSQALLYALGFFYEWDWLYDFQEIVVRIAQPRLDVFEEWTVDRACLLKFAEYVRERAAAAWVQNAPRTPSEKACMWCKIQATCVAKAKALIDLTGGAFDEFEQEVSNADMAEFRQDLNEAKAPIVADIATLTTLEMEKLYGWRSTVERFFKKVGEELEKRARDGEKLKLFKTVEGRSHRVFRSKDKAVAALVALGLDRDDVISEEMISPAKAEELLKAEGYKLKDLKDLLNDLVFKPPGKATLAPIKDSRPALADAYDDAFSEFSE